MIALITVPLIINVIEKSQKNAFVDSAYGIIEAGKLYYMENMNGKELASRTDFKVSDGKFILGTDATKELKFSGTMPKTGMLQLHPNGDVAVAICNTTYCACKSVSELKVTLKSSNCNINSETGEIEEDEKEDGTIAGTVISYMAGNHAPYGYLACDGSVYNISDYKSLANAIKEGFGSYNYYGGDGTTTFAVPDLRGEFLRGTGTNGHENQGSGIDVGKHQDATEIPKMHNWQNNVIGIEVGASGWSIPNPDFVKSSTPRYYADVKMGIAAGSTSTIMTTRPTNTSVLYCIKY